MSQFIAGLFTDSKGAGETIAELKNKGYTEDISVISKDYDGLEVDTNTHQIKQDLSEGTVAGAATGAAIGALGALLTGLTAITVPALGIFIAGPIAATLTAAATGAVVGSVAGLLIDMGIPEEKAKLYDQQVLAGETLVAVTADEDRAGEVIQVLSNHGATSIEAFPESEL